MEEMGDEVAWALQMKRDLEEKKKKESELSNKRKNEEGDKSNNSKATKVAVGSKRMTQEQKLKELKQKMEEETHLQKKMRLSSKMPWLNSMS